MARFRAFRDYEERKSEANNAMMALHEDFMRTCVGLLADNGICARGLAKGNLVELHPAFATATARSFDVDMMSYMTVLRLMRNAVVHNGSVVTRTLREELDTWTVAQEAGWIDLAKRNPRALAIDDRVDLGHGEMVVALAVTKRLDREANLGLQAALPRTCWTALVIDEIVRDQPKILRDVNVALKKARGVARHHYGVIGLTDLELETEILGR